MNKPLPSTKPPTGSPTTSPSSNAGSFSSGSTKTWTGWHRLPAGGDGSQLSPMRPSNSASPLNACGLALRQATGLVESLLRLAGLDWTVPDFSTLSRRQKDLQVRIPVQRKQGCLHLLVDSTGIKMMGEGEWKVKKHGADYRRQWRKLHLGVDAQTLEIRAMEVPRGYRSCCRKFRRRRSWHPSRRTGRTTHVHVTPRLWSVGLLPSFPHAEMASSGKVIRRAIRLAMSCYAQ